MFGFRDDCHVKSDSEITYVRHMRSSASTYGESDPNIIKSVIEKLFEVSYASSIVIPRHSFQIKVGMPQFLMISPICTNGLLLYFVILKMLLFIVMNFLQ